MKRIIILLFALTFLGGWLTNNGLVFAGVKQEEAGLWKMYNSALSDGSPQAFRKVIRKVGDVMREYPTKVNVADMLFLLGLCYENVYKFPKALVYYRELRDVHPYHKNAKAVRYKIDLIERTYRNEKVVLGLFIRQERLMLSGKYKEAVEKCRELLATYPSSSLADNVQNIIGYIYMNYLKDYSKAKKEYEMLLKRYSKSNFRDNAVFAIGRCCEELGYYQSALRQYNILKKKHEGVLFSKTNYWSRVWHTRAEDQIKKVEFKMDSIRHKLYPVDSFVTAKYDLCVQGKHGHSAFGFDTRSIKSWVLPKQVTELAKEKLRLEPEKGYGGNSVDTALEVWNYVAGNYLYKDSIDDYWQEPEETVSRQSGDSVDLTFLLASLLLNDGNNKNKVWVMVGKDRDGAEHYWVNLLHNGEWYMLEPSWKPPFEDLPLAKFEGYTPYYAFNNKALKVNSRVSHIFDKCN